LTLFFIHLFANGSGGRSAAGLFFGGPYTAPFWALVVVAGLAIPLLFEIAEARFGARSTVMTSLLLLGGGFALRWFLVAAGQAMEVMG
jgi:formate-dependent nitrite reductase membrane component NrfD